MKLTLFNGSPRAKKSNTRILLNHLSDGFLETEGNTVETIYLLMEKDVEKKLELFRQSDRVILAFPLYTDAMPAVTKAFIEELEPLCAEQENNSRNKPSIGFIVQSGFPEAIHSRYVERYLEKLARRLGCQYLGTVIKGGVEGLQVKPPWMTRKLLRSFHELGSILGRTGNLDEGIIKRLAGKERLNGLTRGVFKLLSFFGMTNMYWDTQLKQNKSFEKRFDAPYFKSE